MTVEFKTERGEFVFDVKGDAMNTSHIGIHNESGTVCGVASKQIDVAHTRVFKDGRLMKYHDYDSLAQTEESIEMIIGCRRCLAWWKKRILKKIN